MIKRKMQTKLSFLQRISLISLGLISALILLEITMRLGGFVLSALQEHRNRASIRQKGAFRIMCLGESTTARQWPPHLEEILNERDIGIKFSVIDKGVPGVNTSITASTLESNLNEYHPDMVVAMIGINDIGAHLPHPTFTASGATRFFESLRIYKLTRLIWLRFATKLKESRFYENNIVDQLAIAEEMQAREIIPLAKEDLSRKTMGPNQGEWAVNRDLGATYRKQGKLSQAEESFKKCIALDPADYNAYVELGWIYRDQGKLSQAEESFKRSIEINPTNIGAYLGLERLYRDPEKFPQAEETFKRAIELCPDNHGAYIGLGWFYTNHRKYAQAEESFKKAIELEPSESWVYLELGRLYRVSRRLPESEKAYNMALELSPRDFGGRLELAWIYVMQKKYDQALDLIKKGVELAPDNDKLYGALKILYQRIGNEELGGQYEKKASEIRANRFDPVTVNNFHKLKEILDRRGVKFVCVQYPMRSIEPLKKIFEGQANVIFVDNEQIFKDALRVSGPEKYFTDMFGGDFGHCTPKGNKLLAKNIADVILKEVFHR